MLFAASIKTAKSQNPEYGLFESYQFKESVFNPEKGSYTDMGWSISPVIGDYGFEFSKGGIVIHSGKKSILSGYTDHDFYSVDERSKTNEDSLHSEYEYYAHSIIGERIKVVIRVMEADSYKYAVIFLYEHSNGKYFKDLRSYLVARN